MTVQSSQDSQAKRFLICQVLVLYLSFHLSNIITPIVSGSYGGSLVRYFHSWQSLIYLLAAKVAPLPLIGFIVWSSGDAWESMGLRKWRWSIDPAYTMIAFSSFLGIQSISQWIRYGKFGISTGQVGPSALTPLIIGLGILQFLVAAAGEEFFFRGYLGARFDEIWGKPALTVVLSAAMFALIHMSYGWASVFTIFFDGLAIAALYRQTRSILPLVIAHAAYNSVLFLA